MWWQYTLLNYSLILIIDFRFYVYMDGCVLMDRDCFNNIVIAQFIFISYFIL